MAKQAMKKPETIKMMKTTYTDTGTRRALALKFMPKLTSDPSVPKY